MVQFGICGVCINRYTTFWAIRLLLGLRQSQCRRVCKDLQWERAVAKFILFSRSCCSPFKNQATWSIDGVLSGLLGERLLIKLELAPVSSRLAMDNKALDVSAIKMLTRKVVFQKHPTFFSPSSNCTFKNYCPVGGGLWIFDFALSSCFPFFQYLSQ